MKILYHHRIRSRDGQSVHMEELIAALRAQGNDICLVGPADYNNAEFGHHPKLLAQAKRIVPKALYEIAELGYNGIAFVRLIIACMKFRPDFIYERASLFFVAGILASKLCGIPLVLEVNSPLAKERAKFGGLGLQAIASQLEAWTWRHANVVLPVTAVLARELESSGTDRSQIVVVPNAIDMEKFSAPPTEDAAKLSLGLAGKLVLGFTGFVREWNGLDRVIEMLSRPDLPPELHVLIVGDGPAIAALKSITTSCGVESRVTFAGLVPRNEIAQAVAAFDIAIIPQCVEYCSPLKLFEYMACGKAVVAPDQENVREVLTNNLSGLLFPPGDLNAMKAAIMELIEDAERRARLASNAQGEIASRGYTWTRNAERVCAIGASLVRQSRRAARTVES